MLLQRFLYSTMPYLILYHDLCVGTIFFYDLCFRICIGTIFNYLFFCFRICTALFWYNMILFSSYGFRICYTTLCCCIALEDSLYFQCLRSLLLLNDCIIYVMCSSAEVCLSSLPCTLASSRIPKVPIHIIADGLYSGLSQCICTTGIAPTSSDTLQP